MDNNRKTSPVPETQKKFIDLMLEEVRGEQTASRNAKASVFTDLFERTEYAAMTFKNYVTAHNLNLYGSKKVKLPMLEFYVIYTGSKPIDETIRLSEEFFSGTELGIEVTVKVISSGKSGDIIDQYIRFTHIFDEICKEYGRTGKAVEVLIERCKEENVLVEYLTQKQREEPEDLMNILFDDRVIMRLYEANIREEGREEGREQGRKQGREQGREELLVTLVEKGKLPLEAAAEELNETKEAFLRRLHRR